MFKIENASLITISILFCNLDLKKNCLLNLEELKKFSTKNFIYNQSISLQSISQAKFAEILS